MCTWKKTSASCWTSECECPLGSARLPPGIRGPLSAIPSRGPPGPPCLTVPLHRLRIGTGDVLTFYDGDDLTARVLGQYSGPRGHFKLFTSMADVTIQFQSDPGASVLGYQQGFVIHFFGELAPALPCPALLRGVEVTPGCRPPASASQKGQGGEESEHSYLIGGSWDIPGLTFGKLILFSISPEGPVRGSKPLLQGAG